MGLITNLVQMKAQRDLQAKQTAISGFKSILENQNATPEMRQWAQQGILDVTVPAIAGDGKDGSGGGKKQHEGIRHILGSLMGGIGSLNPMASGPSKGVKSQIAQATGRPRPAKMELTQEEQDQIKERQERAAAQIREDMAVKQSVAIDKARAVQARLDDQAAYDDRVKHADAIWGPGGGGRDRADYVLTGKMPNAGATFKNTPGLTLGSDPKVKAFADANGLEIDPAKGYRLQTDSEGNIVSVMEAAAAPQQQRLYGAIQGYYYDGIARGLSDDDAKKFAGRMFEQYQGVHLGRVEQQAAVDQALSGIGLGRGLNPDAAAKGLGATAPAPAATPAGTPAPSRPAFTGIGAKQTPKSAAPTADANTSRAMDMFWSATLGNTPTPTSGPSRVGFQKGQEAVEKLTGLSSQDFALGVMVAKDLMGAQKDNVDRYVAMQRLGSAMDLMGPNVDALAKNVLQTGSPWLNRHIRDLKTAAIGDPNIAQLMVAVNDFQRQYAVLTAGGALSRAQLPVATQQSVDKIIDPNQTLETVAATLTQIRKQADLETQGFRRAIDQTSGEIKERVAGGKSSSGRGGAGGGRGGSTPSDKNVTPAAQRLIDKYSGGGR
jgi:hypothetical protein